MPTGTYMPLSFQQSNHRFMLLNSPKITLTTANWLFPLQAQKANLKSQHSVQQNQSQPSKSSGTVLGMNDLRAEKGTPKVCSSIAKTVQDVAAFIYLSQNWGT